MHRLKFLKVLSDTFHFLRLCSLDFYTVKGLKNKSMDFSKGGGGGGNKDQTINYIFSPQTLNI